MPDAAEIPAESPAGQGSGPDLALLPLGAPFSGLTPAQLELRRRVLDAVSAPTTKLAYGHALDDLFRFLAGRPLDRALLQEWRASMDGLAPSTINVRMSAVRKLVAEARAGGMLGVEEAASLTGVPNIRQQGTRLGNWLTREQARELLQVPDRSTLKGKRDYAILALLVGCALRRQELATLDLQTIQLREGRWVLADLVGKGRRVRTVAVPLWVKQGINAWQTAAGDRGGPAAPVYPERRQAGRERSQRLGRLGCGATVCQRDWNRAVRRPRSPPYLRQALQEGWRRSRTDKVPAWALLDPDDRAISRGRTGDRDCG